MNCRVESRWIAAVLIGLTAAGSAASQTAAGQPAKKVLRAGVYAIDITPTKFPVIVNGMFEERTADRAHDPLHARCLVLDDGGTRIAIVVVDSLMMPREFVDEAKKQAAKTTTISADHILVAATHTHSAPAVMGCLGSRVDAAYREFLMPQIVRGIQLAEKNLRPAQIGWAVMKDYEHTNCRRWIRRPDRLLTDPFGRPTARANMHPGYQSPDVIGPSGPVDPDLSVLAVRSPDGRAIALLANYSMHYYGAAPMSADYFGRFAQEIKRLIGPEKANPSFVGIMSQGTSGDLHWMDYSKPRLDTGMDNYAAAVVRVAFKAYEQIKYHDWVPLAMAETKLTLRRRVPDERRLAWAKEISAKSKGPAPRGLPEIYAREQILLHQEPVRELKLQAIRIGELGITAIPNEVFGITGLKIKAHSPLQPTFNVELANGAEGYIPPPEQHHLGGYTTWPARTAGLEVQAEPKIVEAVLGLLETISGKSRRETTDTRGDYADLVLASKPLAYWRLEELTGPTAEDATGNGQIAPYEDGVVFYLEGPPSPKFSGEGVINRAVHFAGGRLKAHLGQLSSTYSVEMWFWNGLPSNARAVTGYLFSRGADGAADAAGDHLGIGGTNAAPGRLLFGNGNKLKQVLAGKAAIKLKTWNHVVLVRDGKKVSVYLNGTTEPEIAGEAAAGHAFDVRQVFIGGRNDNFANWEGKIDEVALYNRALTGQEAAEHYKAAGMAK